MGDKLLDTTQIINGIAVLLSFFVGYKYAVKRHNVNEEESSSSDKEARSDIASALAQKVQS